MQIPDEVYGMRQEEIDRFLVNRDNYRYSRLGVVFCLMQIPYKLKTGIPIFRCTGKRTAGGRRCKVYHVGFYFYDRCSTACVFVDICSNIVPICFIWKEAGLNSC
jgi:hypothetical protein